MTAFGKSRQHLTTERSLSRRSCSDQMFTRPYPGSSGHHRPRPNPHPPRRRLLPIWHI